jgi:hypothetical protein
MRSFVLRAAAIVATSLVAVFLLYAAFRLGGCARWASPGEGQG